MKKLFTILAIALCSTLATAQTNQYFWAGGQFIMGNPINQIDSITFGQLEQTDSILLYLPRTVKVIHDTVIQYVTIHDTINPCAVPDGAISGVFSISSTKQARFAQGNLQYNAVLGEHLCADGTTQQGTWRFSENQYDYLGEQNYNRSSSYAGWVDLFSWGTSGWNSGASCYQPWSFNTPNTDYLIDSLQDDAQYADWSVYNAIENGGNQPKLWRLMTKKEWEYLLFERSNASNKVGFVNVNGVNGLLLLPDNWQLPNGCAFEPILYDYTQISYTLSEWNKMENAGAVFLPAAGFQRNSGISQNDTICSSNVCGWYFSSSLLQSNDACNVNGYTLTLLVFCDEKRIEHPNMLTLEINDHQFHDGRLIRPIQEVK